MLRRNSRDLFFFVFMKGKRRSGIQINRESVDPERRSDIQINRDNVDPT